MLTFSWSSAFSFYGAVFIRNSFCEIKFRQNLYRFAIFRLCSPHMNSSFGDYLIVRMFFFHTFRKLYQILLDHMLSHPQAQRTPITMRKFSCFFPNLSLSPFHFYLFQLLQKFSAVFILIYRYFNKNPFFLFGPLWLRWTRLARNIQRVGANTQKFSYTLSVRERKIWACKWTKLRILFISFVANAKKCMRDCDVCSKLE